MAGLLDGLGQSLGGLLNNYGGLFGNVGAAMPESYGANAPIMDPLAKAVMTTATLPQRAMESSANMVRTGQYDPAPILEAAMLPMGTGAIAGVPMRAGEAVLGAGPIRAYHGSPHDFNRFDLSKIGTGEGAQAYGHGLYFAENEAVAKGYRDALAKDMYYAPNGQMFDPQSQLQHLNVRVAARNNGHDLDATIARANELLSKASEQTRPMLEHDIQVLQSFKDAGGIAKNPGRMYEVQINADPEHFLDWDKPLSQQSEAVRQALKLGELPQKPSPEETMAVFKKAKELGVPANTLPEYKALEARMDNANADAWQEFGISPSNVHVRPEDLTGGQFVQGLEQKMLGPDVYGGKSPAASNTLREAGIPGIKYLDQGSRGAGEGSRNYVVFDDKLIDILKKYGLAGLAAPTVAYAGLKQDQ